MIMQSFYIAEDEAYGTRESDSSFPSSDFTSDSFYEDLADYCREDLEEELAF